MRAERQLILGGRRRIHIGGVELRDALRFVGSGDIDVVDGRRAYAASRREGLVRDRAVAHRLIGDGGGGLALLKKYYWLSHL